LLPSSSPCRRKSQKNGNIGFGGGKYVLIDMADDFDAPLEDFKDYM